MFYRLLLCCGPCVNCPGNSFKMLGASQGLKDSCTFPVVGLQESCKVVLSQQDRAGELLKCEADLFRNGPQHVQLPAAFRHMAVTSGHNMAVIEDHFHLLQSSFCPPV